MANGTERGRNMLARMGRLDGRMRECFGGLWKGIAGPTLDQCNQVWLGGLSSLSDEEIKTGLVRVVSEWTSKHPPAWPEFRELARPADKRTPEQRARDALIADNERQDQRALPSVEQLARGSTVGGQWLAWMRLRGLRPMPLGMTVDDLDAELGDADVGAMDAAHERELASLRGRMHERRAR